MAAGDPKWQKDASDQNFDYMFKLLIIGNSSVGKTSFLFRYADDSFTSAFVSTVGIDFKVKTVFRHDKRVKLQIWVRHMRLCIAALWIWRSLHFYWYSGHCWTGAISNNHHCILSRCHGIYSNVWYYKRRELQLCSRLVSYMLWTSCLNVCTYCSRVSNNTLQLQLSYA